MSSRKHLSYILLRGLTVFHVFDFLDAAGEPELLKFLFPLEFNPHVRPVQHGNDAVNVSLDMSLSNVVSMNEQVQVVHTKSWIRVEWVDPKIHWNPADFNNVSFIQVPPTQMWTPDIVLYNEVGLDRGRPANQFLLRVDSSGRVLWMYALIVETSCKMDVSLFPYDSQDCLFEFGSWSMDGSQLDLHNKTSGGETGFYVDNGDWVLTDIRVTRKHLKFKCCVETTPIVTFHVALQRRYVYYVFNLVLPCVVITFLGLSSYLLPAESGEKVSLNVTILLGQTVFLLLVAQITPPQSEVIPLMGEYFAICIITVAISTALSVLILHLHFRGSRGFPVPPFIHSVIIGKLGYILCYGGTIDKHLETIRQLKVEEAMDREQAKGVVLPIEMITVYKPSHLPSGLDTLSGMNGHAGSDRTSVGLNRRASTFLGDRRTPAHLPSGLDTLSEMNGHARRSSSGSDRTSVGLNRRASTYRGDRRTPVEDLGVLHRYTDDKEEEEKIIIQDWILVSLVLDRLFFIFNLIADVAALMFVLHPMMTYG